MECPVCHSSGISDETKACPQCDADLEAFQLLKKIEKTSKNRLIFGSIAAVLFIILLVVWIIIYAFYSESHEKKVDGYTTEEVTELKANLSKAEKQNNDLKATNKELLEKLAKENETKAVKEDIYIVNEGETLFSIAKKIYGDGFKYVDLAKDNNIEDPDIIVVGQKLTIYH